MSFHPWPPWQKQREQPTGEWADNDVQTRSQTFNATCSSLSRVPLSNSTTVEKQKVLSLLHPQSWGSPFQRRAGFGFPPILSNPKGEAPEAGFPFGESDFQLLMVPESFVSEKLAGVAAEVPSHFRHDGQEHV